jgi:hypothetical protein
VEQVARAPFADGDQAGGQQFLLAIPSVAQMSKKVLPTAGGKPKLKILQRRAVQAPFL